MVNSGDKAKRFGLTVARQPQFQSTSCFVAVQMFTTLRRYEGQWSEGQFDGQGAFKDVDGAT
jgi:hypothetical protein